MGPESTGLRPERENVPLVVSDTQVRSMSRAACPWEDTVLGTTVYIPCHPELRMCMCVIVGGEGVGHDVYVYIAQLEL